MKVTQKKLLLIIGLLAFLIVVSIGGIKATSTSGFCRSCHFMSPAVDTWTHSSHDTVACLKCHADEGFSGMVKAKLNGLREVAITVSGNVPEVLKSEVEDYRCLSCHQESELQEDSQLNFSHKAHLGKGSQCTTCHARVVHAEPDQKKLDKQVCLDCHQEVKKGPVNDCLSCHKEIPKPSDHDSKWISNHKKGDLKSCMSCHQADYCATCHKQ